MIVDILKDLKLPVKDLIGKGFDGAANMSGKDEGVQRHLTEAGAEFSIYFHCFADKLNLVLEQSVETVPSVKEIFETIGDIYRYMEGSPKRHKVYENHLKANAITSGKTALHSFFDTRWTGALQTWRFWSMCILHCYQCLKNSQNRTMTVLQLDYSCV